ncbi:MAG: cytochrome c oxidase subunit II, partial [Gammaproteobacteria bacterium]
MFVNKVRNCLSGIVTLVLFLRAGTAAAEWDLNLTRGVTPISQQVYDLHMLILWVVTIIGIGVFGVIFWSIYHHRKSRGAVPAQFHHSTVAEFSWTIIPILILVGMAIPATKTLVMMEQTGDADITIKITGYQWKWEYDYMNEGIRYFSTLAQESSTAAKFRSGADLDTVNHYLLDVDNPLVLPINKKVRLLTTAKDVIHAWWVPALGWKRDAIPGFINDNWAIIKEPGVYRGQCTELCGVGHGYMPIVVKAVPEEEYLAWVEEIKVAQAAATADSDKEWTADELKARGEEVYKNTCAICHQADGKGLPGTFPALDGSAIVNGPAADHI